VIYRSGPFFSWKRTKYLFN